jgi:hypothetical protein
LIEIPQPPKENLRLSRVSLMEVVVDAPGVERQTVGLLSHVNRDLMASE